MTDPKRQPLDITPDKTIPPNPMRTLQGPTAEDPSPIAQVEIKAMLVDLLTHDPEVRALLTSPSPSVPREPDAALATWVKALIEQTMYNTLRADAYRRPK
jgi:hypothetical protein